MTESTVEEAGLAWLEPLGWVGEHGPDIAPGEPLAERSDYGEMVLSQQLRDALACLNPESPAEALEDAFRRWMHPEGTDLNFVLFVNGLPLVILELKNAADEQATIWSAYRQLQTYKQQIPSLFTYNEALVISDGLEARVGTLTADRDRFMPGRTIGGDTLAPAEMPQLEVLTQGIFEKRRFLELVRYFVVFEDEGGGRLAKKMAGYHQFHAVRVAVAETLRAAKLARVDRLAEGLGATKRGASPAGSPVAGASGWSGTPRA